MTVKRCPGCGRDLPTSAYHRNRRQRDGLQAQCRECKNARQRAWYRKNQAAETLKKGAQRDARRQTARRRLYALLVRSACADCGESDPACLDFDHVRGEKRMSVATMVGYAYGWEAVRAEIAKCEVRCANCHRKKTAREQGWYADLTPSG